MNFILYFSLSVHNSITLKLPNFNWLFHMFLLTLNKCVRKGKSEEEEQFQHTVFASHIVDRTKWQKQI
jgi:hypothetical protein